MRDNTALFIGHSEFYGVDPAQVSAEIRKLTEQGITDYLCGGMGDFDWRCARAAFNLKAEFTGIRLFFVIPYLTFNIRNMELFDDIIYPEGFEKYHFKAAITQQNRYMVRNSSVALCYITHSWGGAVKTYEYAKRQGLQIVNLGNYE